MYVRCTWGAGDRWLRGSRCGGHLCGTTHEGGVQVIAGFVAVVAVAIFAVPTSVLGAGFIKAVQQAQHCEFTMDMD